MLFCRAKLGHWLPLTLQEVAGRRSNLLQELSPLLGQKDLHELPKLLAFQSQPQLQAWGKRTSGCREEELLLQFWKFCLTGLSGPFAVPSPL